MYTAGVKYKALQKEKRRYGEWSLVLGFLLFTAPIIAASFYIYDGMQTKTVLVAATETQKNPATVVETAKIEEVSQGTSGVEEKIFGQSTDGKPITGFVIGTGTDTTLMFGSIHGNEMGTADLLNTFVKYVKSNPSSIGANERILVIPILNPDGYYDRTDKLNANEVNLNLNFGTSDWAMYGSEGQYAGPEAWSEAESRVLRDVVLKYLPNRMIAYHSNGSLTNPEFSDASAELAWWYGVRSGYTYYADPAWDYSGTATKWFEETYKKAAITIELNDHYMNDWSQNKAPMLELLGGTGGLL